MVFQFQCPQGHVLEGNESDVGQMSQCPACGDSFLIPSPLGQADAEFVEPTIQDQAVLEEVAPPVREEEISVTDPVGQPASGPVEMAVEHQDELLHIDCPNGHELEVPRDMLDQDALCPRCNVQFRLREVDSVEHQHKRQVEMETRERRVANAWLNWTIALGIVVVLFFLSLWALTAMQNK